MSFYIRLIVVSFLLLSTVLPTNAQEPFSSLFKRYTYTSKNDFRNDRIYRSGGVNDIDPEITNGIAVRLPFDVGTNKYDTIGGYYLGRYQPTNMVLNNGEVLYRRYLFKDPLEMHANDTIVISYESIGLKQDADIDEGFVVIETLKANKGTVQDRNYLIYTGKIDESESLLSDVYKDVEVNTKVSDDSTSVQFIDLYWSEVYHKVVDGELVYYRLGYDSDGARYNNAPITDDYEPYGISNIEDILYKKRLYGSENEKQVMAEWKESNMIIDDEFDLLQDSRDSTQTAEVFNSSSFGLDLGDNFSLPRVKVNFVYYKLDFLTYYGKKGKKQKVDKLDMRTLSLPLFLFTRLTVDYDSTNSTAGVDGTSYDGAPITMRLMPSWRIPVGLKNSVYTGAIIDYRGLNVIEDGNNILKHGGYLAIGIRYTGRGMAYTENFDDAVEGRWALSLLGSWFYSSAESINQMFEVEENVNQIRSFQAILSYKALEKKDSNLNFTLSYQRSSKKFRGSDNGNVFKVALTFNK